MTNVIRVLYVDDETSLLEIGKLFLEESGDFSVTTAISAPVALRLLEQEKFDTIISDYQMPGMDGIQFLVEVRKRFGTIPFILFTGRGREEVVIRALNSGADFYLQKGGDPEAQFAELSHKINQASSRKKVDDAFKESETKYHQLVELAEEGIWAIDANYNTTYLNPRMAKMLGYTVDEMQGLPLSSFMDDAGKMIFEQNMEHRRQGITEVHLFEFITKGGSRIYVTISTSPLTDEKGAYKGSIAVISDITKRKQAEEALRESEEKYRAIVDHALEAIMIIDPSANVLFANPAAAKLVDIEDSSAIIGKNALEIIAPESREAALADLTSSNEGKDGYLVRYKIITATTRERWVELIGKKISFCSIPAVIVMFRDITEHKKAEEALQRQSTQLSILNAIITTANKADNLPQLLESILTESLRLLDFDVGGIYLVDRLTRTANIVHSKNLPKEFLAEIQTAPIDKKPYDTLFIKNEPIITDNYAQINPDLSKRYGFLSMASIPLLSKGIATGALNLASTRRYVISEEEKQTLLSISRELGSTIERMAAEEEAKKAAKNLETLFNSINEMVFVLDMQGRILVVNNTVLKRLLYTPEELTGTDVLLLHVPEQRDEALQNVKGMIAGTNDSCPVPVLAKDGTRIEVETKVTRGWWNNQEVFIGVSRDITGRKQAEEELRESEEKYRALFSAESDGIFVVDKESGTIIDCNDAITTIYGYRKDEVIGRLNTAMSAEPDATRAATEEAKSSIPIRYHKRKDDTVFPVEITANIISVKGREVIVAAVRDITGRKQAEQLLLKSEEQYRNIVEDQTEFICRFLPDGTHIFVNDAYCRYFGIAHEDILGHRFNPVLYADDRKAIAALFASLKPEIPVGTIDHRIIMPGGTVRWQRWSDRAIFDEKGEVAEYQSVGRDITEYKLMEVALRKSEENYRHLIENANEAIIVAQDGLLKFVNPMMATMTGYSVKELTTLPYTEIIHPDDRAIVRERRQRRISGERIPSRYTFRINSRDNSTRWVEISAVNIDWEGRPATLNFLIDITERKELEEAMKYHAQELQKFSTSLATANKKLTLLSGITRHDITNQLIVLVGYLRILEKKQPDTSFSEHFKKINNSAQQISAMLRFTKEYEQIGVNAPVWRDCRTLVDTAAKDAPLGKVLVKNELPAGAEVWADPLVVKVFYNLMDNAVRYGKKITTIRFFAEESGDNHLIVCEDDGAGVVAGENEMIFERGFGKNTGLGLALSREILSITGITIRETGEPGKGARFEMTVQKGAYRSGICETVGTEHAKNEI